jgi:signal peptide peptidase SppA
MSQHRLPHLAQRLFNRPLAILPDKAEIVMAALADRFGVARIFRADGTALAMDEQLTDIGEPAEYKPYAMVDDIAVIPIEGTLVHRLGSIYPYSGMTGYDGIRQLFAMAWDDPTARAIVLDIDSPGGEVAGCFDLVDAIHAARETNEKPIWAILNESAYSAAYAIASAATRITVPRTGGVGSVGVIAMHCDMSRALTAAGLTVTVITYGARKADGVAESPLSKEARARFQADIDTMGDLFVATVARNRGLSAEAVKATEAGTFLGEAGVGAGFADAIASPDENAAEKRHDQLCPSGGARPGRACFRQEGGGRGHQARRGR